MRLDRARAGVDEMVHGEPPCQGPRTLPIDLGLGSPERRPQRWNLPSAPTMEMSV